ncbi:MAG: 3-hydroxyacyl-CoA dehydrogenase family protein [Comamonadaceae bacterium]|nr:3-hydroxyacyl-CoA dehydrogenase family protein [Comamonadaceae bacterium]
MVDDLTGKKLGRASSGTFRTADVVGLDTMAHVIKTLQDNLQATTRSTPSYATPPVLASADRAGRAGPEEPARASTRRSARTSCASTPAKGDYVPAGGKAERDRRAHAQEARRRAPEAAARDRATRRRSSCGRSCATASTTPRCTWRDDRRHARATSTSRCAGASA